ncbi:hypothetical protein COCON_G00107490 [Conger conger]|uniref:Craniofacial development protein 1 n=1 Tax=Conger conger TaxID=82655 RepID=A0A9Q1HZT0_CONCO|nr:hypothetical protein COCON_G00107490 [Conger conger]
MWACPVYAPGTSHHFLCLLLFQRIESAAGRKMNYSDYDSDDYSSSEDEDYVPSDDNLSEDDMNECEKEEGFDAEHSGKQQSVDVKTKKKKKQSVKGIGVRKRKKVGLQLEGEGEHSGTPQEEGTQEKQEGEDSDDEESRPAPRPLGEIDKKKADDLWASFLSDVGPRPNLSTPVSVSAPSEKSPQTAAPDKKTDTPLQPLEPAPKAKVPSKITITKVFDFAGEEVRVTKEVESDSKEAQNFLKMQEKGQEQVKQPSQDQPLAPGPSVKRPAGMGSVLSQLSGKKQKMSTLEKSKLDWDTYKSEEGIVDELATHNRGKEGYIERKNFLERVDFRQFEQEKTVRLSNMKR